jgi:predicted protein tyrosine phosphatase
MLKKSHISRSNSDDLLINDWNSILCKTANHHVNASRTIERQLTFWVDIICWWERQCKIPMNASFSWIMKVLVWRHISAGFLVLNPLWTHVAWEYQNTDLGACLNLSLAIHMPGEFNEAPGGANEVSTRSDVLTFAPPSLTFFPFLVFFFCSFLFYYSFLFSFSFLFGPFLSGSFTVFLYVLLSFGRWRFSKCNSMTSPAQVNARWSDFPCSFPQLLAICMGIFNTPENMV